MPGDMDHIALSAQPWRRARTRLVGLSAWLHTSFAMQPDEMKSLLESSNIGFSVKEIPHGRQFRFGDGAIASVYNSGKIVWQGKDTPTLARVKSLCSTDAAPAIGAPISGNETVNVANNKVFIVYGHDLRPVSSWNYYCAA